MLLNKQKCDINIIIFFCKYFLTDKKKNIMDVLNERKDYENFDPRKSKSDMS